MNKNLMLLAALGMAVAANATGAPSYKWVWDGSIEAGEGYSNYAGIIDHVEAEYVPTTQKYSFSVTFKKASNNKLPNGFWLATSDGPNPKGKSGELPIFYFDASRSTPVLTAYGYNGKNDGSSWYDGAETPGTQAPDKIASSKVTSNFIENISVQNVGTKRTMSFAIRGALVNNYVPNNQTSSPWTGLDFASKFGIWFHPLQDMSTSYGHDGFLTSLNKGREGYLDLFDENTTPVPEPATITVLALGAIAALRRRSK